MAKKYENCFVSQDKTNTITKSYLKVDPKTAKSFRYMDEKVVPGCEFGCDNMWLTPAKETKVMDANKQPYDRFFGFYCYNYENIRDLCAELEVYIGGEKHIVQEKRRYLYPRQPGDRPDDFPRYQETNILHHRVPLRRRLKEEIQLELESQILNIKYQNKIKYINTT